MRKDKAGAAKPRKRGRPKGSGKKSRKITPVPEEMRRSTFSPAEQAAKYAKSKTRKPGRPKGSGKKSARVPKSATITPPFPSDKPDDVVIVIDEGGELISYARDPKLRVNLIDLRESHPSETITLVIEGMDPELERID